MKTEHTPGPWTRYKLESTRNEHGVYFSPVGRQFVTNELRRDGVLCASAFGRSEDETDANASLIAAAPELLEALEALYMSEYAGNSTSLEDAMNRSSKTDEFEQKIVKAIKKARGL